jgi:hypothetical protein
VIVSHRYQFVFVKTRKTAGTSVEIALSAVCGPDDIITPLLDEDERIRESQGGRPPQCLEPPLWRWNMSDWGKAIVYQKPPRYLDHLPAITIRRLIGRRRWDSYFSFAVERNPWDLAVSAYFWHRYQWGYEGTFHEFIRSSHLKWYSNWPIYSHKDRVMVDAVLRFEQLEQGLHEVASRLCLPEPLRLPMAKAAQRVDRRPYQELYTANDHDVVASVFRREIEEFRWRFG